jgi:4'-phosphopantetheinyl transferase
VTAPAAWIEIAPIARVLARLPELPSDWLSESESARLAGLRHPGRRAQYLAGHWLVRALLARARGGTAAQWILLERKSLPPAPHGRGEGLRVSISHTDDWVAAAVADVAIGIDLERRTRLLDATIEPLLLEAGEAPGRLHADVLLQRWVAKEAWIKRDGGSALAARIASLRLQAASPALADVRVYSHAEFHCAVAVAPGCTMHWAEQPVLTAAAGFAVGDDLRPAATGTPVRPPTAD